MQNRRLGSFLVDHGDIVRTEYVVERAGEDRFHRQAGLGANKKDVAAVSLWQPCANMHPAFAALGLGGGWPDCRSRSADTPDNPSEG